MNEWDRGDGGGDLLRRLDTLLAREEKLAKARVPPGGLVGSWGAGYSACSTAGWLLSFCFLMGPGCHDN